MHTPSFHVSVQQSSFCSRCDATCREGVVLFFGTEYGVHWGLDSGVGDVDGICAGVYGMSCVGLGWVWGQSGGMVMVMVPGLWDDLQEAADGERGADFDLGARRGLR